MNVRALGSVTALSMSLVSLMACGGGGGETGGGGSTSTTTTTGTGGETTTTTTTTSSSTTTTSTGPVDVQIGFEARVGDKAFSCADTYDGLGTGATQARLVDFRFYVHDVRLIDGGGAEVPVTLKQDGLWQYQDVALLDFEDKGGACDNGTVETNHVVVGTVPAGTYKGVAFKLGVPDTINHADVAVAASPLNLSGMFWNWQGGYKFVRVDAMPTDPTLATFNMHLGSTGCTGDPAMGDQVTCSRPNIADVVFDAFDAKSQKIVFDYAALVASSDIGADAGGAPGCMSGNMDPECGPIFTALGLDLATGMPMGKPAVFSVK
jgi:uncharacterized repeat protein (TIGR04052 family)